MIICPENISISEMFFWIKRLFLLIVINVTMNRIKEVLEEKGIKQTWLAEKLCKSYNMVNSYVQNRRQPSLELLNTIADILNVDVKDLIISTRLGLSNKQNGRKSNDKGTEKTKKN